MLQGTYDVYNSISACGMCYCIIMSGSKGGGQLIIEALRIVLTSWREFELQ